MKKKRTDKLSYCDVSSQMTLWVKIFFPLGVALADPPDLSEEDEPYENK